MTQTNEKPEARAVSQVHSKPEVHYYIYVATPRGMESPCKIGYAGYPAQRLKALNCGRETPLVLRSDAASIERAAHKRLRLFRVRGEWFDIEWRSATEAVRQAVVA